MERTPRCDCGCAALSLFRGHVRALMSALLFALRETGAGASRFVWVFGLFVLDFLEERVRRASWFGLVWFEGFGGVFRRSGEGTLWAG